MKIEKLNGLRVEIKDTDLLRRREENRSYMMELTKDNLLLNYRFEAGLYKTDRIPEHIHGGWESPVCELRGHFLGHWLSAAAMMYEATGDNEVIGKANAIVHELFRCQQANGGEWAASIPEKYLYRIANKQTVWAPQYTIHKTFMGLMDMYEKAGNEEALKIATSFSHWFYRWVTGFSKEEFDEILDIETGGMLEIWAQLYGITKEEKYITLMEYYYRRRLFDPLLEEIDVLTNMHANTTIPEILGAARAYEVTGDKKWFRIVEKYWELAVTERGSFATGGQTNGEVWTPKNRLHTRLGNKNQEHCTVYNMMRLADFLFRYTGNSIYADYWERNLYNGIMAQGYWRGSFTHGQKSMYPEQGLLTYFLPLKAGAVKGWSSKTNDFYCCHGSLVQANAAHNDGIYYKKDSDLYICQFFNSDAEIVREDNSVKILQRIDTLTGNHPITENHSLTGSVTGSQKVNRFTYEYPGNPEKLADYFYIIADKEEAFTINIRVPWWITGTPVVLLNHKEIEYTRNEDGFISIHKLWKNDVIYIEFPKKLHTLPLPGKTNMVAFLDGPVVLAGLCKEEKTLYADISHPENILENDNEREWSYWQNTYRTIGQRENIAFVPLNSIGYDPYTVYFPIAPSEK
ncbi:beta-L-arabinofuranosidase domain-containing protein [Anaerocolumna sp. MB42-C2]|uniref:beta-L-arabinofuranosidase domain-containing protein n=1 Tax=Anaerocolumna sp. MB42-C2 TaxID=3070997 RepID=UPI0027E165F5|nr:beta-L-arabinofuranosidase domain-containing protein [Anaerocolumna sp. MB42-C2]WMJ89860.1 glycoside hydrolase family 127 protein [Anaerocolumna sp. MB42-C2]